MYKRAEYKIIKDRILEPRKFIQVVMGPRQVGKSTVVKQVLNDIELPFQFFSADNVPATDTAWLSNCWEAARSIMANRGYRDMLLIIDEIQKIKNWSEAVKKEYDKDTFDGVNIKVLILGSSRVLIEKGLSESLGGRFEEIRMTHWSFLEMKEAFGYDINHFLFYGGYPGAAGFVHDEERFHHYIESAIVDATINKDILLDTPIGKPALLRQTFELGASYSGQLLSLNKMVGALQDAGNTTTLSGYLKLLDDSGLLKGLHKYSNEGFRSKASIPKFQVYNNALKTLYTPRDFEKALVDRKMWGQIAESGIGAFLASQAFKQRFDIFYWRDKNNEVDFVLRKKGILIGIEVKSNADKNTKGMETFRSMFTPKEMILVGDGGIPFEEFLSLDLKKLF